LDLVQQSIWPNEPDGLAASQSDIEPLAAAAAAAIAGFLPSFMDTELRRSIAARLVEYFACKQINLHLVYTVFDLFISKLFPELESKKIVETLLSDASNY
jgi:hypothetical protein